MLFGPASNFWIIVSIIFRSSKIFATLESILKFKTWTSIFATHKHLSKVRNPNQVGSNNSDSSMLKNNRRPLSTLSRSSVSLLHLPEVMMILKNKIVVKILFMTHKQSIRTDGDKQRWTPLDTSHCDSPARQRSLFSVVSSVRSLEPSLFKEVSSVRSLQWDLFSKVSLVKHLQWGPSSSPGVIRHHSRDDGAYWVFLKSH